MPMKLPFAELYIERARRFRDRAEELRTVAGAMQVGRYRDQIVDLARQYDGMADKYESKVPPISNDR